MFLDRIGLVAWRSTTGTGRKQMSRRRYLLIVGILSLFSWPWAALAQSDEWQTIAPNVVGLDQKMLETLVGKIRDGEFGNIHSLLIARNGRLAVEEYFRGPDEHRGESVGSVIFSAADLHDLRSVTKSVVSALFGIALASDPRRSVDDPILSYFPQYKDLQTPDRLAIRLRDLLSMTAGWDWNEDLPYTDPRNSETRMDAAPDRYRFILEQPMASKPGQKFTYNGGCTALLAAVIARWAKMPIDQYAEQVLFRPLQISQYEWIKDATGTPIAASGLRLRPRDLLKFGQLYLDKGKWNGAQIVPESWVEASLTPHVTVGGDQKYGYQWWLLADSKAPDQSIVWGAAYGNGGQRIWLVPSANVVVVLTAGLYNDPNTRQILPRILNDYILAAIH
jgi:CubicO group peptidase (beta-lactamase class C family)